MVSWTSIMVNPHEPPRQAGSVVTPMDCEVGPMNCQRPDRDCPKLKCGYPLPCPYHTATMDLEGRVALPPEKISDSGVASLHRVAKALNRHYPKGKD